MTGFTSILAVDDRALATSSEAPACDAASPDGACAESDAIDPSAQDISPGRRGLMLGLVILALLTGLLGLVGFQAYQVDREQNRRAVLLDAGRQAALRLTTITESDVEAHAQEILDSATGPFFDDFQKRTLNFVETVKRAQSTTEGSIVEAGLESVDGDKANVLVAVSVKTVVAGTEAPPRLWRMRIGVERMGPTVKVSNVEFVS